MFRHKYWAQNSGLLIYHKTKNIWSSGFMIKCRTEMYDSPHTAGGRHMGRGAINDWLCVGVIWGDSWKWFKLLLLFMTKLCVQLVNWSSSHHRSGASVCLKAISWSLSLKESLSLHRLLCNYGLDKQQEQLMWNNKNLEELLLLNIFNCICVTAHGLSTSWQIKVEYGEEHLSFCCFLSTRGLYQTLTR